MAAWLSVSNSPIYAPFFRIPLSKHLLHWVAQV